MMNRPNPMYKRGGLNDEGGEIDEVSGNKVPIGGTKKGVRDDIEVNMSAGEWVADEATTRYHGLKTFLSMRDEAMMGMKKMEAMGLMGNSDEATLPTDMPFGMADLIVVEVDEKNGKEKEINMQPGGVLLDQTGETISLEGQQQTVPVRENVKVTFDQVMAESKMEFKEYRNAEGQSLMVPFIGGVPLYPIPEGYTLYTGEGSEIGETDLPTTGAEEITPSAQSDDDDDKERALAAYRASKKDTSIQWDTLSDEEFLKEANARNGFGRNLAMGIASMISPFAAVGMAGLMAMEDKKVLAMARARLANLPTGSAQRAAYEKMIEGYEARGKGLFGGIISKVVDILGNVLGTSEEAKAKAQNANLVANSGLVVGRYSSNGQITAEGTEAVNSGVVEGYQFDGTGGISGVDTITTDEYKDLLVNINSTDKAVSDAAKIKLSNYIGDELGSYVNPNIMNSIREGMAGLTPEQTRVALVNIAYQPSTVLKDQLDALTPNQQKFIGYTEGVDPATILAERERITDTLSDPNAGLAEIQGAFQDLENLPTAASGTLSNYLDISDEMREQISQVLPQGDVQQAPARTFMTTDTISDRAALSGDTGVAADNVFTTADMARVTVQNANDARQQQVNDLMAIGVDPALAEAAVPKVNVAAETQRAQDIVTGQYTTPEQTGLEALEDTSLATTDRGFTPSNVAQPVATTTEAVTPMSLGYGDRQTGEFSGVASDNTAQSPDQQLMVDPLSAAKLQDDAAVTAGQQAYATSTSTSDPYDPRGIIPDSSQLVTLGTGTRADAASSPMNLSGRNVARTDTTTTEDPYNVGQLGEFAGFGTTPEVQTDRGFDPTATQTVTPTVSATDGATSPRQFEPVTVGKFDSATVQEQAKATEDAYMEAAFGASPATTLADVVPDSGGISTPAAADTMSFDDAFAAARAEEARLGIASGTGQFEYNGQMYSTATAEEAATQTAQTQQDERQGKYDPTANTQLSGGYTANTLSSAEQDAFDYAVDSGNTAVADHFASVNRLRNKQDEFAASGFDETLGRSLGLSQNDMDQAREYGGSIQTAINEGRAESGGFLQPVTVLDPTPTTSTGRRDDDGGSTTTTTTTTSRSDDRDNNVASSGRTETQIQADINAALDASGGEWTSELNDLVSERDSARANEGTSTTTTTRSSSNDDGGGGGGGGGGGASNDKILCDLIYRYGYLDKKIWELDEAFGDYIKQTDPELLEGYHIWAKPMVKWIEKESFLSKLYLKYWCVPFTRRWANHIAHVMEPETYKPDYVGKLMLTVGVPISRAIYKIKNISKSKNTRQFAK